MSTDLATDTSGAGFPSTATFGPIQTSAGNGGLFTQVAARHYDNPGGNQVYGELLELLDTNSSDNFSAFIDVGAASKAILDQYKTDITSILDSVLSSPAG
ncbi:MAG: hypothetical protein ACYDAQ_17480 [Mycobacteriales bacterium]